MYPYDGSLNSMSSPAKQSFLLIHVVLLLFGFRCHSGGSGRDSLERNPAGLLGVVKGLIRYIEEISGLYMGHIR